MDVALTDHTEADASVPSARVYDDVLRLVRLADRLGFSTAWFAEHHAHAHAGHMPAPLLLALHAAGRTERIRAGTSVLCLNLHHPVEIAESVAVADVLSGGRLEIGLGSGSTPPEARAYGVDLSDREARHDRFVEALDVLELAWSGEPVRHRGRHFLVESDPILPRPSPDLRARVWIAATSVESAELAGRRGYNLMLPRERTRGYLNPIVARYREARSAAGLAPDSGRVSAGMALYVGETDDAARAVCATAVERMVERNRRERAAVAALPYPRTWDEQLQQALFVAGSPRTCLAAIEDLRSRVPFTTLDVQPRWDGLRLDDVLRGLERFAAEVLRALQ